MSDEKSLYELDAWIAEHVMNWMRCTMGHIESNGRFAVQGQTIYIHDRGNYVKEFKPSTDHAAAMLVLEKCADKRTVAVNRDKDGTWCVAFIKPAVLAGCCVDEAIEAETLPLGICKFAKVLFSK